MCNSDRRAPITIAKALGAAFVYFLVLAGLAVPAVRAQKLETIEAEGQPLAANVKRLVEALEYLGAPMSAETSAALKSAADARDAHKLQQLLDPHVLLVVSLNPESRVKVARGPAPAVLQQAGFTPSEAVRHRGHRRPYDVRPLTLGYRDLRGHLVLDRCHKRS